MQLAMAALSKAYKLSESVINSMLDLIMGEALVYEDFYLAIDFTFYEFIKVELIILWYFYHADYL